MRQLIRVSINEDLYELAVEPRTTLLEVLRESLGLTGTKEGCGDGNCGSCTVLIDGKPVLSCLTLALDAQEKKIVTIEGLARAGELDPLQESFVNHGAIQCGFCTPGMIMSARALLDENPAPSEAEIREAISGNLCRCTGYVKIVEAIQGVKPRKE